MRIFVVVEAAYELGGAEIVGLRSAVGLAGRGHEVTVLAAYGPVDPQLLDVPGLSIRSATQTAEEPGSLIGKSGQIWRAAPRRMVAEALHGGGPSVIHFHSGSNGLTASAFGPLADSGLPVVYTHHDYAWACPTQGFFHYRHRAPCGIRGGSVRCLATNCTGGPRKYPFKLFRFSRHRLAYEISGFKDKVRKHIFVSPSSARILEPYLRADASSQVVRNPIDVAKDTPAEINAEAPVGFVGRMTVEKDPVLLAEAASAVHIPVQFIGGGPLLGAVKSIYPDAEFPGWIPKEQVQERIRRFRSLVLTSRWYEAQPLVITEAHAAGIPVVVPTVCAGSEAIEHGRTGLFYEAGDLSSLSSVLEQLKDVGLCRRMGLEAYDRYWADPPTMQAHLETIERIYADCGNA